MGGFDPSGGAGVLADAAAMLAAGARPLAAVTTLTVQTHAEFRGGRPVEPRLLDRQLAMLLEAYRPAAAKTGALPEAAHVRTVARRLGGKVARLVVDPVLGATRGPGLVGRAVAREILRRLLPHATLVTPNVAEASALTGRRVRSPHDAERAAFSLLDAGAGAVLVKGGGGPDGTHLFVTRAGTWALPAGPRRTLATHGGGCTLASAIAAGLAAGLPLEEALVHAQRLVVLFFELASKRRGPWGPDPLGALGDAAGASFALE
ncbi:MAG: bifunctional hydroxymethylpyrimidine kinase/phosphomethylpyrimidine kinase [Acidobacteria bacterium]|nr:bifunctional hydroxymethylpyrimidine kinase/phosphomethylpyrimidine kinase [Acidobacteriota bacterium]